MNKNYNEYSSYSSKNYNSAGNKSSYSSGNGGNNFGQEAKKQQQS
jgi:hypothetical protein